MVFAGMICQKKKKSRKDLFKEEGKVNENICGHLQKEKK